MLARALTAAAIGAVAFSGLASAQNTFCERYTGTTDAALQYSTVSGIVLTAAAGSGTAGAGTVQGLFYEPNNKGYFNGTLPPFVDYTASANSALLTALATHLNQFFTFALGCRLAAANSSYSYSDPKQMYAKHAAMKITPVTMGAFISQVAGSVANAGITLGSATDATSELAYFVALFAQFYNYPTDPSSTTVPLLFQNAFKICTAASCPMSNQIAQLHINADNTVTLLTGPFSTLTPTTLSINQGDYVNFRYADGTTITQATSATATTGTVLGASGTRTYTTQMNTAGTYYYYVTGASTNRIQVTVVASTATGSGSSSSTGKNGAAATASLGLAAVIAVAAAAFVVA